MNTQEIIKLIHSKFNEALQTKTSWDKLELQAVFNNITIEVLAIAVDTRPTFRPKKVNTLHFTTSGDDDEIFNEQSKSNENEIPWDD